MYEISRAARVDAEKCQSRRFTADDSACNRVQFNAWMRSNDGSHEQIIFDINIRAKPFHEIRRTTHATDHDSCKYLKIM